MRLEKGRSAEVMQAGSRTTRRGVTIIELLVVLAIIGLLATVAYSTYSGHVLRARITATRLEIAELERACAQYELDCGQYPVSSSGNLLAPNPIDPANIPGEGALGCGYLITCLTASLNGDPQNPVDPRWNGPYIELDPARIGTLRGEPLPPGQALPLPQVQLLDRWGTPYYYVRSVDYATFLGTRLPPTSPFANEIWYNPSTVQIVSYGLNQQSLPRPNLGLDPALDDNTNFRY